MHNAMTFNELNHVYSGGQGDHDADMDCLGLFRTIKVIGYKVEVFQVQREASASWWAQIQQ